MFLLPSRDVSRRADTMLFNALILLTMLGILVSLGFALYFLVKDPGASHRTVRSLTVRVSLAALLLLILLIGFLTRYPL